MLTPRQPSVGLLLPPVLISFVALVLALIVLLAGTGPQQESLEPYHIIAVNLSHFGQDLVASQTSSSPKPSETGKGSWLDDIVDDASDLGQEIKDGINHVTNDIADKIIGELGISEWYSLHILAFCEGMFSPNASDPGAGYNLTSCATQQVGFKLNLGEILDHEIRSGPLSLNLNQLPVPEKVQNAIDVVNSALLALLVLYALASSLAGVSFLLSLAVLVLLRKKVTKPVVWVNVSVAGLGALVLLIGGAVITYINNRGVQEINDAGKDVGISGIRGSKLITLAWIDFGLMLIISLYWGLATLKYTQRWIILADNSRGSGEKTLL